MDELKAELKKLNSLVERFVRSYLGMPLEETLSEGSAFRAWSFNGRLMVRRVKQVDPVKLKELWGIDHVIGPAKENLEAFLKGLPAQNVLIYGPRGTGKSSVVKALYNEYKHRGLKIIEVSIEALQHLDELIEAVQDRKERFVLFCDDLSFHATDSTFLNLKRMLEGGLEVRPENLVIYATSNRRNLVVETRRDNLPEEHNGELHPSDSLEEKISLSERFGLRLYTGYFQQNTYLEIVKNYLNLRGIEFTGPLRAEAIRWANSRGGFTGRVARQFVQYIEAGGTDV